ncbi:MAG: acetate--CoA ligase family protein [Bacteroidales bacterium]
MITEQLINPRSIVIVGGSNDVTKPGGKVLKNLIDGNFAGDIYVTNLKESEVQGVRSYSDVAELPEVDLAIIAIAAPFVPDTARVLAGQKNTRAFIVLSAGFGEESEEGAVLEKELVDIVEGVDGTLIGPNCTGVLTPNHHSVFTYPIPKLDPQGCDFVSGSGATACFIMEAGIPKGLSFANVFSVGNSAQVGVEEVVKYWDESFDPALSSRIKLLYIEDISKPQMLLHHAASLIRKGCRIAAVKAGSSEAGSRAASSHTGALASPDEAVEALFRRAGIVRCYGREDLISVASVFMCPKLKGKKLAIVTHAGGPAVMLTDALSEGGLEVPSLDSPASQELLTHLHPGSSVANPVDFLATGTAEQLGIILDYADKHFTDIDGIVVIFGTPGLFPVFNVYDVLDKKIRSCKKPIYPVLPSILTAKEEVEAFIAKGHVNFPDEVTLGRALGRVYNTPPPSNVSSAETKVDRDRIRRVIDQAPDGDAYLTPRQVQDMLDAAGILRAAEVIADTPGKAVRAAGRLGYPVVMKVVGPVHKSDVGGVALNIKDDESVGREFDRMMQISDATGVLLQPMLSGTELFAGVKLEENYGHMVLCGMGGIFIEVLRDVTTRLTPLNIDGALEMIDSLKSRDILEGVRGQEGVDIEGFAEVLVRLSALAEAAPEIYEMDLNPLLGNADRVVAVDARIRIVK